MKIRSSGNSFWAKVALWSVIACSSAGCALFERHHSYATARYVNGQSGFQYNLGYHRKESRREAMRTSDRRAIKVLLAEALAEKGFCESGYEIVDTLYSENSDLIIVGVCKQIES